MKTSIRLSQNAESNSDSKKMFPTNGNGISVCLKTLGCRTNQSERDNLLADLYEQGFSIHKEINSDTDFVIINSCIVTRRAEQKTNRLIRSIAGNYPHTKIVVAGCLSQMYPDQVQGLPGVRCVVGNSFKDRIPAILGNDMNGVYVSGLTEESRIDSINPDKILALNKSKRTRLSLKIQEGCNFRCTYCIVPHVRGPSRCAEDSQIIEAVRKAADSGYKEIVLTGTHIGRYKTRTAKSLIDLIEKILKTAGGFRVRLSSLDIRDIDENLLNMILGEKRVCSFCHLSVQSLSEEVLLRMNRKVADIAGKIDLLNKFKKKSPDFYLGGDFIVGFPGETARMFNETLENIKAAVFDNGHVFRFSARYGTPAFDMKEKVPENEIKKRSGIIRTYFSERFEEFKRSSIGRESLIIVETERPVSGITSNYIKVKIPDLKAGVNDRLKVRINGYDKSDGFCTGVLV